jgi:uncharacterized protein
MADTPTCAMCRARPVDPKWRPFCSERCQVRDLGAWADGTYRVAGEKPTDREEDDKQTNG